MTHTTIRSLSAIIILLLVAAGSSPAQNRSMAFNGTNQYITNSLSGVQSFATNGSFSVQFWAKRSSSAQGYVVGQGTGTNSQGLHVGFRSSTVFTFAFFGDDLDSDPITYDTKWHHYAVTYNASTKARKIYMDGLLIKSGTAAANYSGSGNVTIGVMLSNYFAGSVDEVMLFNAERSQAEIQASIGGLTYPYPSSMVSYCTFLNVSGNSVLDDKANNWMSATNSPTYENPSTLTLGQPAFSANPSNYNFGSVAAGATPSTSVYVKNSGSGILNLNTFSSSNALFSVSPVTPRALFAGDSVQLTVSFAPTATGVQGGSISITNNTSAGTNAVPVSGYTNIPTLTSFTPVSGAPGATVTITGTNFSTTPANNTVMFGGVKAVVTSATSTSLSVKVPLGAAYGPITLVTGGYVARSRNAFIPTFSSDNSLTASSFPTGTSITFPKLSNGISRGTGTAADFDGDGKPDLVHVAPSSSAISVHRNVHVGGALTSASFGTRQDFTTGSTPADLDVGDIDGDGKPDIVVMNINSSTVSVFRNTSTPGTISFAAKVDYATAANSKRISLGDLDGDRKLDIGIASSYKFSYLRNLSTSGTISYDTRTDIATQDNPADIKLVDLDGDGIDDVSLVCGGSTMPDQVLSVFRSTGVAGTISFGAESQKLMDYYMTGIEAGDFDGDGKPDLYAAKYDYNVYVIPNTSTTGNITLGTTITLSGLPSPSLAIADLNGDGKPEAILANGNGPYVRAFKNTSTSGSVSFDAGTTYTYQEGSAYYPMASIVPADLNMDGKTDLIGIASASYDAIGLFENKVNAPQFRASSYDIAMGSVPVGTFRRDSVNITNNGGQSLTISSVANSNSTDFTVTPSSATIASGSNQWFVYTLSPNTAGTKSTKLTFTHTAANITDSVSITATAAFGTRPSAGNAVQLDGVDDYLSIADATHPTAYTIEGWVKFNTISAQNIIVRTDANGPSATFSHQLSLTAAGKFAHYTYFNASASVTGTTTAVAGQWYHVSITAQSNGTMRLYVNGAEEGTAQSVTGTLWNAGSLWRIGQNGGGPGGSVGYLNGTIDELRIWSTVRTPAQIQASYASQAGNETNLSRYYRFDEVFGTSSGDAAGNARTASLVNGASFISSTAPVGTPVYAVTPSSVAFGYVANGATRTDSVTVSNTSNGVLNVSASSNNVKLTLSPSTLAVPSGQSAKLYLTFAPQSGSDTAATVTLTHNAAGSPNTIAANHLTAASFSKATAAGSMLTFLSDQYSDFASTPYSAVLNPASTVTYEAWARSDVSEGNSSGYILASGDYYSGIKIQPGYYGWSAQVGTGGTAVDLYASGKTQGVWYHLAVTVSGSTFKFYVNGVLRDTKTGTYNRNTSYPLYVGTNTNSPWYSGFQGAIDEIKIWNTARTQEQIYADMTNTYYGNEAGLAAYWRFDEGSGTSVLDQTFGGRNLTLGTGNYVPTWAASTAGIPGAYYVNRTPSLSFGTLQTGKTKKDSFYVRNYGGASLNLTSVASNNAQYTVTPVSAVIAAGDSGKFIVTYAPTTVQTENGRIQLTHNAFGSPDSVSYSGTGATANYSASPSSLAFGSVQVGVSRTDTVTVSNTGGIALTIDSIRFSAAGYTVSPASATVAPSGSQKFAVTFAAAAPAGSANATMSLYHSVIGSPGTVSITAAKVQSAAANAGTAMVFDGSNDLLSRSVVLTAVNNITMEGWVKWDGQGASGNKVIFYNGNTSSSGFGLMLEGTSTPSNAMTILVGGVALVRSSAVLTQNQWQHVAIVREAGTWKLYLDGVQQSLTNSGATPNAATGSLLIGANFGGTEPFKGSMDELRIWNTARTQAQIQASYASLTGTESGLAAYYRFDENSGTTAYDNSGNGRPLTLTNGPVFASSAALIGTPAISLSSSSLSFGNVQPGTAKLDSFTISNTGGGLLNIGTITSGNGAYTITPGNVAVRNGSSQRFTVTFQPTAPAASHNSSLSVPHNASGSPGTVNVTGSGTYQSAANAGNAMTFTGNSTFIDIPASASLATPNFTVEAWVKIGATWDYSAIIDKGRNNSNNWYLLTLSSSVGSQQGVMFGMTGGGELGYQWGDAEWHHVAAVFDGTNQRLYVDGILRGSTTGVVYSPVSSPVRIGGRRDTTSGALTPFNGSVDDVRFWNVARTQSEIQQNYASLSGNQSGLVALYRFDESSGTSAYDATGNGSTGTLINAPTRMIPSTAPVAAPVVSLSAASIAYGNVYLNQSKVDSITVTNTGGGALNITAIASDNAQFTVTPSSLTILSGGSGKLYITVLPTALGAQSGTVTLTHNASGGSTGIPVSVTAIVPMITSFTPASGPAGTSVTITGSGFSATPANNIVMFGAVRGTVTAASATSLTVTAPAGATYAPLTVTVGNLSAHSRNGFLTTFLTSNLITASSFASNQSVSAPSNGYGMTFSDIDGDGKPDAVLGVQAASGLSILRNTGSSGTVSFAAAVNFATGSNGLDVATGDLDGDGKQDVVALKNSGGFSIFRNTSTPGTVSFAARIDSNVIGAHGGAIADLDGDGRQELVISRNSASTLVVYRNSSTPGSITLSSFITLTTESGPREVHIADLDGDGKPDLITNNYSSGTISVFRNTSTVGTLSFDAAIQLSGATSSFGLAVGDLTGDGNPEIAAALFNSVRVFQNTSTPGTIAFSAGVNFAASSNRTVTIADVSGDGKADIAASTSSSAVSVLKNTFTSGSIAASSFAASVTYGIAGNSWNLRHADLDGDGRTDLAAISQTAGSMSALRNTVPLPAILSADPSAITLGNVAIGASKAESTYVKNIGGVAMTINAAASTNAQYTVTPATATIAVGDSQKFTVTFTPTQAFAVNANLVFTDNTAAGSDTVSLTGTGVGPVLTLSAESRSFGNVLAGSSKKDSLYLKNTGNAVLSVTGVSAGAPEFTFNATSFTVSPSDSAKLVITFAPTASGTVSSSVSVTHNGTNSPSLVDLDAKGIQPQFSLSAASLALGNVGYYQSKTDSVTVTNTGVDTLIIASATNTNGAYAVTPAAAVIAPSGSQRFLITFTPTALAEVKDTVTFVHNAGTSVKLPLSGTGTHLAAPAAGNALDLSGGSQYADLADGVWFNGNFTVETWVYVRALANYTRIIDFANGPSSNNIIITASEGTSGKIGFHIFNGGTSSTIVTPSAIPLNTWVHVACVFNSGTGRIYLNGTEVVSGALLTPVNTTRTLNYIGKSHWTDPNTNMRVDEFRIWSTARSVSQIRSAMNSSLAGNESGLSAYLRFDEASGTTARNFTGAATGAALLNGASFAASTVPLPRANFFASPASLTFPSLPVGEAAIETTWVRNYGPSVLQIDSVRSGNAMFVPLQNAAVIATGDSARFTVQYTPTTTGAHTASVSFYSNANGSPSVVSASGNAVSASPTVPDSHAVFSAVLPYRFTVKWTKGDADHHLVLVRNGAAVNDTPADGSIYTADAKFGSGAQIGSGNYVVYAGDGDSVVVTMVSAGQTYHVSVIGYNGSGTTTNYLTPSAALNTITLTPANHSPYAGTGLVLDGVNDHIAVNDPVDLSGDSLTIEYWFKGTWPVSVVRQQDGGNYIVSGWDNGGTRVHILSNDGGVSAGVPVGAAEDGNWHHVAMTWKRNTANGFRSYLDGELVASRTSADAPIPLINYTLFLGSYLGSNEFTNGTIDEVRIWKAARTQDQIREYMHRPLSGTQPGLVAYFQLNEGNGTVVRDSVRGTTGAIQNGAVWTATPITFGYGSAASIAAVQSGTQNVGAAQLVFADGFDNASDLTLTELTTAPNQYPSGFGTVVGNRRFVLRTFGSTGAYTAQLSLNFGAGVIDGRADAYSAGLRLFTRPVNSNGAWTEVGGADSANSATGVITWNGITAFGEFAVIQDESALPVELVAFTVVPRRLNAEVRWSTASETDNLGFDVEYRPRSGAARWTSAGFVEGGGTTNVPQDYTFTVRNVPAGAYSFRLKQTDRDGRFAFSPQVEVTVGEVPKVFALEQNYPNPFNPSTTIGFTLQNPGRTTLKIYNMVGQEVATLVDQVLDAGVYHQSVFDARHLSSGVYFARLTSGTMVQVRKLMLMK